MKYLPEHKITAEDIYVYKFVQDVHIFSPKAHDIICRRIRQYAKHDEAHSFGHLKEVLDAALALMQEVKVTEREVLLVMLACLYHDSGLANGDRETHHERSYMIVHRDERVLKAFLSPKEITTIAEAAFDHRASLKIVPRSKIGKIVADADRIGSYSPEKIIYKCIQFRQDSHPFDFEAIKRDTIKHIKEKYATGGYLPKFNYWKSKDKELFQETFDNIVKDPKEYGHQIIRVIYNKFCVDLNRPDQKIY